VRVIIVIKRQTSCNKSPFTGYHHLTLDESVR